MPLQMSRSVNSAAAELPFEDGAESSPPDNIVEFADEDFEISEDEGARPSPASDKVDYLTPLETNSEIEEVSQIKLLIQPMLDVEMTSTIEGQICRNIKFLYCFLAKDSVTSGPTTSTVHIYEQIAIAFSDLLKGTFRQKEYWQTNFYDFFPGAKVPLFFEQWVSEWLQSDPPAKFKKLKYVENKTKPQQLALWNGSKIQDAANKYVKLINNKINPLWKTTIPSGHTFASQFFELRMRVWVSVARARVVTNAAAYRRRWAGKGLSASELDERHFRELIRQPDRGWFPDWWLIFVLCARPAFKSGHQRQSLNSGGALARVDGGLFVQADSTDVGGLLQDFQRSTSRRGQQAMIAAGMHPSADAPAGGGGGRSLNALLPIRQGPDPDAVTYRTPGRGRGGTPFLGPVWMQRERQRERSRSREQGDVDDGSDSFISSDTTSSGTRLQHQLMVQYQQQLKPPIEIQLEALEAQIKDLQALLSLLDDEEEASEVRQQLRDKYRERIAINKKKMEGASIN